MEPILATSSFDALNKEAYFLELIHQIDKTDRGDRVLLTTMTVNPTEPLVLDLMRTLSDAAERGVIVDFAFDAYMYLMHPLSKRPGPLLTWGKIPDSPTGFYAALKHMVDSLEFAGVRVSITNIPKRPRSNPYSGRSHIKTAIVKDRIYIGGCNLNAPNDIDLMTTFKDAATATWLYDTMRAAIEGPSVKDSLEQIDQQYPADPATTILLDAGVRGQSAIYHQALHFIDEAKEWLTLTCQFFPNSTTAAKLLAAYKRGVKVRIIYNHPYKHAGLQHKILQSMVRERERLRMPRSFFQHQLPVNSPFIHAKLLATEQGAIIGSHNYVKAGVQFGTAELALLRYDPALSHILEHAIDEQLAE